MHRTPTPVEPRFWKYTSVAGADECWNWTGHSDRRGYGHIRIGGRRGRIYPAHRVSAALHLGLDLSNSSIIVCHKCDNPSCVNPRHLFLGTSKDNTQDAVSKGRMAHGSRHHAARLTEADIPVIRRALADGESQTSIGRRYGVSQHTIYCIASGKGWKHVL